MCGICGYIAQKLIDKNELSEMNDTMYHRGPNDYGIWDRQYHDFAVGLGHRRLSILDLSALGHQPMQSDSQRITVVYNGEIYNYGTLKKELEEKGYSFRSKCDTEVVIAAYQEWGYQCFRRFNGMFAIAIWDEEKEELVLARDRIGKKPLYYYHNGHEIVFASELKPIMAYPDFPKIIRHEMLGSFLCNKYIVAPYTIFENTYKLIPGSYIIYKKGEIVSQLFWDIAAQKAKLSQEVIEDYETNKQKLNSLLLDAVEKRMISDVPLGTFLSGGIDSTLITALAQKVSSQPVRTFSIGFYEKERNEAPYAAAIAKHIGTEHNELYASEEMILEMLKELPFYYDEPFSDSSQLPTMLVSKLASEQITVALSGDGGDELFCGYNMYDLTYIAQKADFIGNLIYHLPGIDQYIGKMRPTLRAFINNRNKHYKTQLFIDVTREEVEKLLGKKCNNTKLVEEEKFSMKNWQERRMMLDMITYLPDDILTKTDRASMKYSMEVRCPILDYEVIEQSFRIPHQYKYHNFEKKYILKDITYQYVPKNLLDRPKKGFGVPLQKWLRSVLEEEIEKYADAVILERQGIFSPTGIKELIGKQKVSDYIIYSSILWSFYVFQTWYQKYIEDLWNN